MRIKLSVTEADLYTLISALHMCVGVLSAGAGAQRDLRRAEKLLVTLERLRPTDGRK